MHHSSSLTISNVLSFSRIVIAPLITWMILVGTPRSLITGLVLLILASITDYLDGHLARTYNMKTMLGAFLDPLADKILVISVFGAFYFRGDISLWVVLVIVGRDIIVTVLRALVIRSGAFVVTLRIAKLKTALQCITACALICATLAQETSAAPYLAKFTTIMVYGCVAFTLWTGIAYIIINREVILRSLHK